MALPSLRRSIKFQQSRVPCVSSTKEITHRSDRARLLPVVRSIQTRRTSSNTNNIGSPTLASTILNRFRIPPENPPTRSSFRFHNLIYFNLSSPIARARSLAIPQRDAYKYICYQWRTKGKEHVPWLLNHQRGHRVEDTIQ